MVCWGTASQVGCEDACMRVRVSVRVCAYNRVCIHVWLYVSSSCIIPHIVEVTLIPLFSAD